MSALGRSVRALLWLGGLVALSAAGWVGVNKYRGTQTADDLPVAQARQGAWFQPTVFGRDGLRTSAPTRQTAT